MIAKTYVAGGDPVPIYVAKCGLRDNSRGVRDARCDLVFVDVRWRSGVISPDSSGYLPHLQYKAQYAATEEDHGESVLTGNVATMPLFRFDPAPFFPLVAGSIYLAGGTGGAIFDVTVILKRYTLQRPFRHTLTIVAPTPLQRLPRPFGASGIWLPSSTNQTTFSLGAQNATVTAPNGAFAACGPFDTFLSRPGELVVFEVTPPW